MTPLTVVSGGQAGADRGGLEAARELGLRTGGWAPRGYRTEAGPAPELGRAFGLREAASASYQERTRLNVQLAHAVLIFRDVPSAGSNLTYRLACELGRPVLVEASTRDPRVIRAVVEGWRELGVEYLMVAGNRESVSPGIRARVHALLLQALR